MISSRRQFILYFLGVIFLVFSWLPWLKLHLTEDMPYRRFLSDYTIYIQMAEDIKEGRKFPVYYYGQNYMGPLTSVFMVSTESVLQWLGHKTSIPSFEGHYTISPHAAILTTFMMGLLAFIIWGYFALKVYGGLAALLVLMFGFTHGYYQELLFRPNGPEMVLFLSSLFALFALAYQRAKPIQKSVLHFVFGLLVALSLWMNQTVLFVFMPLILYWLSQQKISNYTLTHLDIKNRILLRRFDLPHLFRVLVLVLNGVMLLNFLFGLIVLIPGEIATEVYGTKIKVLNGLSQIKSSLYYFVFTQLLLELKSSPVFKSLFFELLAKGRNFLAGYALVQIPLLLSTLTGHTEKFYGVKLKPVPLIEIPNYWSKLITDYFPRLMSGGAPLAPALTGIGVLLFATLLLLLIHQGLWKKEKFRIELLPHYTVVLSLIFILFVDRARTEYADRYAVLLLLLIPICFVSILKLYSPRVLQAICVFAFVTLLGFSWRLGTESRWQDYKNSENTVFNELQNLKDSGYTLCFANYWDAYRLEYFSGGNVKFIPVESQDRTPKRSQLLRASPIEKCFYSQATGAVAAPKEL